MPSGQWVFLADRIECYTLLRFYRSRYPETVAWVESTFGVNWCAYLFNRAAGKIWRRN